MSTLLVTGANGALGRLVVTYLLEKGQDTIIAASRDTTKIADLAAKGAQTRAADFDDVPGLVKAFTGVDRVLIISTDALDSAGTRLRQHTNAVTAAKQAGVKEVVYTSMPNPETSVVTFAPDHLGTEQAIKASGLSYTLLRNAWYQENLLHALPAAIASGKWYSAAGDGLISYVSRDDCARAAAAALSQPAANQTYTITGADAQTTKQIAALASDILGKPIDVADLNDAQLAQGLKAAGLPEAVIPTFVSFDTNTREGHFNLITGDVEHLTGRKPSSVRQFLEANKAALTG